MFRLNFIDIAIGNLLEIHKYLDIESTAKINLFTFFDKNGAQHQIDFHDINVEIDSRIQKTITFIETIKRNIDDENQNEIYRFVIHRYIDFIETTFSKKIISDDKETFLDIIKDWQLPLIFKYIKEIFEFSQESDSNIYSWKVHILNVLNEISESTFCLY